MDEVLYKLSKSKFRSSFKLKSKDKLYVADKGLDVIKVHAYDFVKKRLAVFPTINDGKQTPFHGHPVFIAQHATATCCRGCLNKWHGVAKDRNLTLEEIDYVVNLIMMWISKELK